MLLVHFSAQRTAEQICHNVMAIREQAPFPSISENIADQWQLPESKHSARKLCFPAAVGGLLCRQSRVNGAVLHLNTFFFSQNLKHGLFTPSQTATSKRFESHNCHSIARPLMLTSTTQSLHSDASKVLACCTRRHVKQSTDIARVLRERDDGVCSLLHPGPPELAHDDRAAAGLVLPAGLLRTDEQIPSKIVIISLLFFLGK